MNFQLCRVKGRSGCDGKQASPVCIRPFVLHANIGDVHTVTAQSEGAHHIIIAHNITSVCTWCSSRGGLRCLPVRDECRREKENA